MKKLLKIMSVITLTTFTTINLSACDFFQGLPPVDWNQRLEDAAKLISSDTDVNFNTFFYSKIKHTQVSEFKEDIIKRIEALLKTSTENYSLLVYNIANLNDPIKNDSATIVLNLSVFEVPNVKKTCTFEAKFTNVQTFVNTKLEPYTNDTKGIKKYFILNKTDNSIPNPIDKNGKNTSLYDILVDYGANFPTLSPVNLFKTTDKGPMGSGSDFWNDFETAKGRLLGNILYPIFQMFGADDLGGLSFFNFQATLQIDAKITNVIAIIGHKNFDGQVHDYMEINLKGVNTKDPDVDLGNSFIGLTYVFE